MTDPIDPDPEPEVWAQDTISSLDLWPPLNQNSWQDTLWTEQSMIASFHTHAEKQSGDYDVEWKRVGTGINDTIHAYASESAVENEIKWRVIADFSPPALGWGGAQSGVVFSCRIWREV